MPATLIATFEDFQAAERARGELRSAGFGSEQIGLALQDGELIVAEDVLARADVADRGLVVPLLDMGVPDEPARASQREFAAGRTVVTVQPVRRPARAAEILRRHAARPIWGW